MKSINGIEIEVGQEVFVLQTPIIGDHQYVKCVVVKISPKTVSVEGLFKEKYIRGFVRKRVNRYPEQIFVV